jgi:hypothetical protein
MILPTLEVPYSLRERGIRVCQIGIQWKQIRF